MTLLRVLGLRAVLNWYSSQFKNNHFTAMCCGTEAGSYLRRIDSCITQLKAQGPPRTCNRSKVEEEENLLRESLIPGVLALAPGECEKSVRDIPSALSTFSFWNPEFVPLPPVSGHFGS